MANKVAFSFKTHFPKSILECLAEQQELLFMIEIEKKVELALNYKS